MKKIALIITCLMAMSLSTITLADSPCKNLETACKAAGYYKGGSGSGKGLIKDCIQPLAEGKAVGDIKVDPTEAANCKVKLDSMMK